MNRFGRSAFVLSYEFLERRNMFAAGDLDPSFGSEGVVTANLPNQILGGGYGAAAGVAAVVEPDSRILILSQGGVQAGIAQQIVPAIVLSRFNMDGSVDTTFGQNGVSLEPIPTTVTGGVMLTWTALALEPDGSILVAGSDGNTYTSRFGSTTVAVARFTSTGALDTGFGKGGVVSITESSLGPDTLLQPQFGTQGFINGSITLMMPEVDPGGGIIEFLYMRLNADGSFDQGFGTQGIDSALPSFGPDRGAESSFTVGSDGTIFQVDNTRMVETGNSSGPTHLLTAERYGPEGALDDSFGTNGHFEIGSADAGISDAIEPDGKFLVALSVAASATPASANGIDLARYNADGTLDTTFGDQGHFVDPGMSWTVHFLGVRADGEILIDSDIAPSAPGSDGFSQREVLTAITADGSFDPGFGQSGMAATFTDMPGGAYSELILDVVGNVIEVVQGVTGFQLKRYLGNGDASLNGEGTTSTLTPQQAQAGIALAGFAHGDPGDENFGNLGVDQSDFSAVVDWGDGQTSSGQVLSPGFVSGLKTVGDFPFQVRGSHTYTASGTYAVRVAVTELGADSPATTAFTSEVTIVETPSQQYVSAVYDDVLGRAPDQGGLQYWTQQLSMGIPISDVAQVIVHSAEYYQKFVIEPDYLKLLGRPADTAGIQFWVSQLQGGLTDQGLEAGFIATDEFYKNAGGSDKDWIDAAYQLLLGRSADSAGESFWESELAADVSRSQVAVGIAQSTENNTQLINADYFHYLGRPADAAGLAYWLAQFADGATNEDLIAGFTGSAEYYKEHTSLS